MNKSDVKMISGVVVFISGLLLAILAFNGSDILFMNIGLAMMIGASIIQDKANDAKGRHNALVSEREKQ